MTFSPARAHKAKIAAEQAAQAAKEDGAELSSEYELALANLDQQRRALSAVQSRETKTQMKTEFLAEWQGYINTTLSEDSGNADPIIARLWIWCIDTGALGDAFEIGQYLIRHDLPAPEGFSRTMPTAFAEEFAEKALKTPDTIDSEMLKEVEEAVAGADMPDEVRAKLYRALGESLAESDIELAVEYLARAIELNPKVGAKLLLKQLQKKVEE